MFNVPHFTLSVLHLQVQSFGRPKLARSYVWRQLRITSTRMADATNTGFNSSRHWHTHTYTCITLLLDFGIGVCGTLPNFFEGPKTRKFTMGPMELYLQAQTPRCIKEDQENCCRYMWHGQVLVMAGPSHIFSQTRKRKFTIASMGTFRFVTLTLRNQPTEIGGIIGDICRTGGCH